jgi:hypothetical protein
MVEQKGDTVEEVIEGNDDTLQKPEETNKEEMSLERQAQIIAGLQKGFGMTRQELAEIRENITNVVEAINNQSGAVSQDEEYLTVGKLKEILSTQASESKSRLNQVESYIDNTLGQLKAEGRITTKEEEDELLGYALKFKESDLIKVADFYDDIKTARQEAKKEVIKTKAKQDEGSKIGTSSKAATEGVEGLNYQKVKRTDWFGFNV